MAKWLNDSILDALLNGIAAGNQILITTTQPTTRANAISASLASTTLAPGDFALSDGTPSGRKVTIAQKAAIAVTATGSATHVAIVDSTNLLAVTTVTTQTLTSGNTVTIPAWTATVTDPS